MQGVLRDCTHLLLITVRTSCPLHGQQLLVVPHCLLMLLIVLVPEEEAAIHTYVRTNSYVVEQIYSIPGAYLLYTINPSFPPPPPHTQLQWGTSLLVHSSIYVVGTADSVLIIQVSLIQSVLYREVPLYSQ